MVQKFGNLLLPNLYCEGEIVLQEGLCCRKTVLQYSLLGSSVLQYTALYCGWKGCRKIVSQYNELYCD